MNTKQLQYVIELSRELNFTYAADNLGITQSSLSQYIKKIEVDLGASLFMRDGNRVEPTYAGLSYIDMAKRILDLEHRLYNDINEINDDTRGRVIIGVSPYICSSVMPGVVSIFHKKYPNIEVLLKEKVTAALIEGISYGEFDMCITTLPDDASEFEYRMLPAEEIALAVPKSLGFYNIKPCKDRMFPVVDFKDMNGMPFISQKPSQVFGRMLEMLCRVNDITVKRIVECVNVEAIHSMVYNGLGCALIPYNQINKDTRCVYEKRVSYYSIRQDVVWNTAVFWRKSIRLTGPMMEMVSML